MTLDPAGLTVAGSAAVVVLIATLVHAVGSSRFAFLIGVREDGPLLFNPVGARLQGIALGYLAALVAAGALVFALVRPHVPSAALPWTLAWTTAVGLFAVTVRAVVGRTVLAVGGRTAVLDEVPAEDVVPVDEVGEDVDLATAITAARRGEWLPAAALLAASGDDDVRAQRVRTLAAASVHDAQWVEEWLVAAPAEPLVTVVRAEVAMMRAWGARGAGTAEDTSGQQFEAFLTGLDQAERLARRATEQAPDDPTPWATLVEIARGQQVGPEEFQDRVDGLTERAPAHVLGTHAIVQTLAPKWFGDAGSVLGAARELAGVAPEGSASCLLPVAALVERYHDVASGRGGAGRATREMASLSVRDEIAECVRRWTGGPGGEPMPGSRLQGHAWVAYAAWLADDRALALPHLEAMGRSVTAVPWGYTGEPGQVLAAARRWAGLPAVVPTGGTPVRSA